MDTHAMISALNDLETALYAYGHAAGCLYHDGSTAAPRGSASARGVALGFLSEKRHELMVSPETRDLILGLWDKREELTRACAAGRT